MKKYIAFFRLKFSSGLQYRAAAIAGCSTQLFFGFVFILVYKAFYSSGEANIDFNINQLVTYLWLNQTFFSLISIRHKDDELLKIIRNGDLAYELCRPQNTYIMWFIRIIGTKLSAVLLRSIPLLIIIIFLPNGYRLSLPYSFSSFLLFILAIIIASLLVTSIISLIYIITTYTIDDKGIMGIYFNVAEILSGQVVPLPFFPKFLKIIASLLPFAYVSDFAFRIYTGNILGKEILYGFIIQVSWLLILIILGLIITNKVMKRVSVQGG